MHVTVAHSFGLAPPQASRCALYVPSQGSRSPRLAVTFTPHCRLPLCAPCCLQVQPPLRFGRHIPRPRAVDLSAGTHPQEVGRHKAGWHHLELNLGSVVPPCPSCLHFLSRSHMPPSTLNLPAPLPRPRFPHAKFCAHARALPRFCGAAQLALCP